MVLYLRSLNGNYCGGLTGNKYENTKSNYSTIIEAGVHLGHKTLRWNPKMKQYIFGKRDSIHIIDLTQTLELTNVALEKVYNTITNNGKFFCVYKNKHLKQLLKLQKKLDNIWVNYRWLGGMLTNWGTISGSIKKMKKYEARS